MTLPVPMYHIGQKVYVAKHRTTIEKLTCPDCLGKGEWITLNPAGKDVTVQCNTCTRGFAPNGTIPGKAIPWSLVAHYTVGSVRIDTAAKEGELVSYMMEETGVGTGSVYYEDRIFLSPDNAEDYSHVISLKEADGINKRNEEQLAERKTKQRG